LSQVTVQRAPPLLLSMRRAPAAALMLWSLQYAQIFGACSNRFAPEGV